VRTGEDEQPAVRPQRDRLEANHAGGLSPAAEKTQDANRSGARHGTRAVDLMRPVNSPQDRRVWLQAEQLRHRVGSAVTCAYLRTSLLELRRPVMQAWASFLSGEADANVVPMEAGGGVIKIAINEAAFAVISPETDLSTGPQHHSPFHPSRCAQTNENSSTLPLGSVTYEPQLNAKGERLVWLDAAIVDRLAAMRGLKESYSDAILRLVKVEELADDKVVSISGRRKQS